MSAHPLPGVFATLAPLLDHYGYLAIAALLFLENLGAPVVPGETMLIAGAIYAGTGKLNIVAVGVIAVAAAVAGSGAGYAIGRFGGRALALRYGRYVFLTEKRLDKAEDFVNRHGAVVVTFARFLEGLRQANGLIAGITEMPWLRFLIFNAVGAVLWVATWASLGDLAGNHITTIYHDITRYSLYVLIVLVIAVAALIGHHLLRRRRAEATPATSGPGTSSTGTSGTAASSTGSPSSGGSSPAGSSPEGSAAAHSGPAGTTAALDPTPGQRATGIQPPPGQAESTTHPGTSQHHHVPAHPRAAVSPSVTGPAEVAEPAESD